MRVRVRVLCSTLVGILATIVIGSAAVVARVAGFREFFEHT